MAHCATVTTTGLTVVRDDGPGHGGSVDAADHPEHAEPAEVLATLLLRQELRVVGEDDGDGAADAAGSEKISNENP